MRLAETQCLTDSMLLTMQVFAKDVMFDEAKVNRIDQPVLLDYYLDGWRTYSN